MLGIHLTDLFQLPDHALIEKVKSEHKCRACHVLRGPHRVLSIGWLAGETNDPNGAVALCGHCLETQALGDLDIWDELTVLEVRFAIVHYGSAELARRALFPGDYDRNMERARRAA